MTLRNMYRDVQTRSQPQPPLRLHHELRAFLISVYAPHDLQQHSTASLQRATVNFSQPTASRLWTTALGLLHSGFKPFLFSESILPVPSLCIYCQIITPDEYHSLELHKADHPRIKIYTVIYNMDSGYCSQTLALCG